eukprot:CAMPEP_0194277802 /NCGR_PEP_ID=MMETSP0169-20130528/10022_1 /TAXON_ID=218684 /ORGANISM="Corethron pennatum, Strain L29A3" /LENGTH=174 /DNA_ID=CAMNT_0039021853 /DNA_START=183 /DNA_END=704 /DNA_ORIENTATION=+
MVYVIDEDDSSYDGEFILPAPEPASRSSPPSAPAPSGASSGPSRHGNSYPTQPQLQRDHDARGGPIPQHHHQLPFPHQHQQVQNQVQHQHQQHQHQQHPPPQSKIGRQQGRSTSQQSHSTFQERTKLGEQQRNNQQQYGAPPSSYGVAPRPGPPSGRPPVGGSLPRSPSDERAP